MTDKSIIDLIPLSVAVIGVKDEEFHIVDLNAALLNAEKLTKVSMLGESVTKLFKSSKHKKLFKVFARVHKSAKAEQCEIEYKQADKNSYFRYTVEKLNETSVVCSCEVLDAQKSLKVCETDRKLLEKELEEKVAEQNVLLSLFDKGTSILFKWKNDEAWSVAHASQSVERLLGYSTDDFLSAKISYAECVHRDDLPRVMDEVNSALEEKKEYFEHTPYRLYTKLGEIKWVYDSTILVRDSNDNVTHFIGYVTDITEMREKEQQLLRHNKQAQMGEMISMIAHQWRQPLGAISISAASMKMNLMLDYYDFSSEEGIKSCKDSFQESLSNIEAFTQTLSQTIDDFRYFYKPNKKPLLTTIDKPVKKALETIETHLSCHGTYVEKSFESTKELNLYDSEIMQVVMNILKNAQDNFLEKNIKNTSVKIVTYDTEDGVALEVCDNGGGIKKDVLDKIFEPYFSTKSDKNGTGLGLYMSKMIIEENHKGKLIVSNKDDGVCFLIELFEGKLK